MICETTKYLNERRFYRLNVLKNHINTSYCSRSQKAISLVKTSAIFSQLPHLISTFVWSISIRLSLYMAQHHSHSFTSFVSLPPNLFLISTLAFLSFPQTLFSSYSSYNNRLKICLLFSFQYWFCQQHCLWRERGERQKAGERNEVETTGKRITFYICGNALTFLILLKWRTILCFTSVQYLSINRQLHLLWFQLFSPLNITEHQNTHTVRI